MVETAIDKTRRLHADEAPWRRTRAMAAGLRMQHHGPTLQGQRACVPWRHWPERTSRMKNRTKKRRNKIEKKREKATPAAPLRLATATAVPVEVATAPSVQKRPHPRRPRRRRTAEHHRPTTALRRASPSNGGARTILAWPHPVPSPRPANASLGHHCRPACASPSPAEPAPSTVGATPLAACAEDEPHGLTPPSHGCTAPASPAPLRPPRGAASWPAAPPHMANAPIKGRN